MRNISKISVLFSFDGMTLLSPQANSLLFYLAQETPVTPGAPKSESSNAAIAVNSAIIERMNRLRALIVEVKAGSATRKYRVVKADGPDDLVFQSLVKGGPMRDNNILTRVIKPAARKVGLDFVNWHCLRRSHATWLMLAGSDVKDAQARMRHSRASTTMDIYRQFVPESHRRAVDRLSGLMGSAMVN